MDRKIEKNIFLRGSHQYRVRVLMHGHRLEQTFETLQQARDWRDSKRIRRHTDADYKRVVGADAERRKRSSVALKDVLAKYRTEISEHKVMPQAEIYRLEAIRRSSLGALPFYSIEADDVRAFLRELHAGKFINARPRKTKAQRGSNELKYLALLSHTFNVARKEWGMPARNPVADVAKPRPGHSRERRVSHDEFNRLVAELERCDNPMLAPLARLALWTGARMGELLTLRWEHVQWRDRSLRIVGHYDARGRHEVREVPFDFVTGDRRVDRLLTQLRGRKAVGNLCGLVFKSTSQGGVEQAWRRARERAGLPEIRFHDLRHEAVSRLYEGGRWRDLEIMLGVGHRSLAMTRRYAHLSLKAQARSSRAAISE